MTAINLAAQPSKGKLHVLTDAAGYRDGKVVCFANKSVSLPQWPGLITSTGSAFNTTLFRSGLAEKFQTWDEMIHGAEAELPQMVGDYGLMSSTVILAGISATRGPEIYCFDNDAPLPAHIPEREGEPYKLVRLPDVIMTPPVTDAATIIAANYEGIDVDADPELVIWSMRQHLAMQRAMPLPDGIGGIGGFGELTTISADGITQRIVDRWPEDKIGAPLHHEPVDKAWWDDWNRRNPKPGQSRLRRDMEARKGRKRLELVK